MSAPRYHFGEWVLDLGRRELLRGTQRVHLSPKALGLVELLAAQAPDAVSKQEIQETLWPRTFVSEANLTKLVAEVRTALEDDARQPHLVRTVHGFGYALCGPTTEEPPSGEPPDGAAETKRERDPYPGLAPFAEADAASFFGREAEVEALWERLRRTRLLALLGSSGAGKTSFVRAGVVPARPEGWGAVVCTPGHAPMRALARALAPELAGDPEALRQLPDFEEPGVAEELVSRWRRAHAGALVAVDQLEELFTLNPQPVQAAFARLLRRISSEAGVHVLLSLRDDFLLHTQAHEPLKPVLGELSALLPLSGDGLRRAVEEPARRRGYRFEDPALVGQMVSAVEGERGGLPLLAFAVARLWEMRDRGKKLLTLAAYDEIGGVTGALAQHAETTLARVGPEGQLVVREIFRNLVTAHGTRGAVDREELLSAFPRRGQAEEALGRLVDARLLTSFEVPGRVGEPGHRRVEIVHESLLSAWPRLVWWRAQDEEGAHLRDQLRQAAHLWEEKGRTGDLLWTGTAYREFEVWRGRYPGALTALEEDFARSMTERAHRQRRRRRAVAGVVVAAAVAVAAVTGALWRRSEASRREATAEALRAEAGKLLALARAEINDHPTAALAYTRKSLELADTPEARRFAVEVLWRGPVARILPAGRIARELGAGEATYMTRIVPSPDGNWLAIASADLQHILLFPRDGGPPRTLPGSRDRIVSVLGFGPHSDMLFTPGPGGSLQFWSLPDLREMRRAELMGFRSVGFLRGGSLHTFTRMSRGDRQQVIRAWPLPDGEAKVLGRLDGAACWDIDPTGTWLAFCRGRSVHVRPLETSRPTPERILGETGDDPMGVTFFPRGDLLASVDRAGEIRLWSLAEGAPRPLRTLQGPGAAGQALVLPFENGKRYLAKDATESSAYLWDLGDPPDADPVMLKRPDPLFLPSGAFDSKGDWLITGNGFTVGFWPLSSPRTRVLGGQRSSWAMAFTPDGRWLATCLMKEPARLVPLDPADGAARTLVPKEPCWFIAPHPAGTHVLVGTNTGKLLLWPTAGGEPRRLLERWETQAGTYPVAFDVQGRRAIAGPMSYAGGLKNPQHRVLRVSDLGTGEDRVYSVAHLTDASWNGFETIQFTPDGQLFAAGQGGVRRLVLPPDPSGSVSSETVYAAGRAKSTLSPDGRYLLALANSNPGADHFDELLLFDLAEGTSRRITTHGRRLHGAAFDTTGRIIVTGDIDGVVRVGPVTGEEPHLLLGYTGWVTALAVSPDGRWVAAGGDRPIRLWPMPDVTRPPLHTLPHAELMARLDALTNLRVIADPSSSTGWQLDIGPFPGWATAPSW